MKKLAVLLSGSGTTLENIFSRIEDGSLEAEVAVVIGTKESAYGLERARKRNIPAEEVIPKNYASADKFSTALTEAIDQYAPDLVVMAGFMFLYHIPAQYEGRVVNIHPALIPAFCGKGYYGHHVHEAVVESGVKITGCTVHFADNVYDHGPIIMQKAVEVDPDDTADDVAEKVQAAEREIYPKAIQLFCEGRLKIEGRTVRITD